MSASALQAVRGGKFKGSRRMQRKAETAAAEGPPAASKGRMGKKQQKQKQKQKHAQKQQQRGQHSQKGAARRQGRLRPQGGGVHKGGAHRT